MTSTVVARIAEQAIWAEFMETKTSAFPQRDDEDTGIPAFIFAMLVPADVVALIFVDLHREVVNFFARQGGQLSLKGDYFCRSIFERNHAD